MSVMFDPEAAIYPFPPKPMPLNRDEKHFYREKIKRLLRERDAVMVARGDLGVELGDIASDLLLGLRLGFAGEHLAAFHSLLVKVPDDTLPAAIGAAKDVAVGGESFLWHLAAPFLNHQHYPRGFGYVQP